MIRKGRVISSVGKTYNVADAETGTTLSCLIRGKMRLKGVRTTNPVAVGDIVEYECDDSGQGFITSVDQRRNYIIRRASNLSKESHILASNIDQAIIVVTLYQPETKTEFIDRFLVTCEAYKIPAVIVLNKCDLLNDMPEAKQEFADTYSRAGYEVMEVSATEGHNIGLFASLLECKTTLLSGNSGVGKSSLIKCVDPDADVKTGGISKQHNKGRHTTTFSRMYSISGDGYIIDTPGIKGFGLIDIDASELHHYFPEFMKISDKCQYYNCTHTHEPGCAVVEAVENGDIAYSRYVSYIKMLEEDGKHRK